MCFLSAFSSSPIHRLKSLWGEGGISKEHKEQLVVLRKLLSMEANMAAYREYYDNVIPPKVPFLGIHLQDYTFLDDANPTFRDDNKRLINFSKYHKLFNTVSQVLDLQKARYMLRPLPEVTSYLMAACGFENHERAAFNFSRMIENADGVQGDQQELVPPPVLSKDISELYRLHRSPARHEGPEIRLLNQRVGIMLAQVNSEDTADRKRFWAMLDEKLQQCMPAQEEGRRKSALPAQLRQVNMRLSRVRAATIGTDFREIVLGSKVVSASILSALIRFPQREELASFKGILAATLMPCVDVDELTAVLEGLSNCKLLHEQCLYVAELLANYKEVDVGSRTHVLAEATRRLGPLKQQVAEETQSMEQSRECGERRTTIDRNATCVDSNVELITCYHTVVKLTQELVADYQGAIDAMTAPQVESFCESLLDVNLNASLRHTKAEEAKSEVLRQGELEIQDTNTILAREEARVAALAAEEEALIAELAEIDAALEDAREEADSALHYGNFLQACTELEIDDIEEEITALDRCLTDYSTISKSATALYGTFQKVGHAGKVSVGQIEAEIDIVIAAAAPIVTDLLKRQTAMCTFVLATTRQLKGLAKASKGSSNVDDLEATLSTARSLMDAQQHFLVILVSLVDFKDSPNEAIRESASTLSTKLLRLNQLISQVALLYNKLESD
mmetsp:Transcript_11604/g.46881  ORF Transcript_11604/g.46881 Transcript_11604/m.46881 type:complete len:679 (+) Transcript_11604:129-2165(+)